MNDYKFSIMIISTQKFCERLKQSIIHISEKLYNDDIKLKLAENVADIINSEKPDTGVDFVAIVVDTTVPNAIEKDNLSCRVTAERIIKVAAFSCGYNSGIPGILPTPNDLGLIS
uniref:Uncharacterized protein n=1 Tax=Rhodnius prolixus TaxID=13249 RepID=T1HDS2_RHOPR